MANLDRIIDNTKLYQDIELATAIGELKKNPQKLQQFLQSQQEKVFNDVTKQKDVTFQKVYGDLSRMTKAQESSIMYNLKNIELGKLNKNIYETQKKNATSVVQDKDLANRKYEMNEWTVNNKKDTLFFYSMLFIVLCGLILIICLWKLNIIDVSISVLLITPLLIILAFTFVYKSEYTKLFRDTRYWNRSKFGGNYGNIPTPLCNVPFEQMQNKFNSINIDDGIASVSNSITGGTQSAADELSSWSKSMQTK